MTPDNAIPPDFDPSFASPAEWAAMYRACLLQVVPAHAPVVGGEWKFPLLPWGEFQNNLVSDTVFDRWYGHSTGDHCRRLQMGVITGRCSGNTFVIDLDDQKGPQAEAWWQGLLEVHNSRIDLETVEQRTGGGGRQKLFRAPMDWVAPTNKTSISVDIRGQGGFAMLPPSRHESGKDYEWLPGRAPWEVPIADAPEWLLEAIEALVERHGGVASGPRTQTASGESHDAFGNQIDGREEKMTKLIWAAMLGYREISPIPPGTVEFDATWADYERHTRSRLPDDGRSNADRLEAEGNGGRGISLFRNKWRRALKKWDGRIAEEAAHRTSPKHDEGHDYGEEFAKAGAQATAAGKVYQFLDVDQIMALPDPVWLVEDLINEQSMGFIFGPPGSLKTFIALDLALSIPTKASTWWNRRINQDGATIYLCREGTKSLKFRIQAWEQHRGASARGTPFYLIEQTINFMRPEDVGTLLATVEAIAAKAGVPITAVFVDTVSRVLPGAEENLQKDMSLFIAACEAIQQRFNCIVVGVHHVNKNGSMRGSTVLPGAGDFLIETRREPGAMMGSIVIQKVKDGEDGQEFPFKVTKVDLGGIVPRSSLMVDPDGPAKAIAVSGGDLPDVTVCREILGAISLAWFNKMPWCKSPNGARPAITMIMGRWQLKREPVKRLLEGWMANGIIEEDFYDRRNKLRGYRKLIDL